LKLANEVHMHGALPLPFVRTQDYSDNSATGNFVWLVRSTVTVSHWTFVPRLHYQRSDTCSRHVFSHVLTSLTNCFAGYEQRTMYCSLPM